MYNRFMKIKTVDFSKTLKKYSSKWIALEPGTMKVVTTGEAPRNVLKEARKKGVSHPVLTRAPKDYGAYIL